MTYNVLFKPHNNNNNNNDNYYYYWLPKPLVYTANMQYTLLHNYTSAAVTLRWTNQLLLDCPHFPPDLVKC